MRYLRLIIPGLFLAFSFVAGGQPAGAFLDGDGDGVPDASDVCQGPLEDLDGVRDDDGCPDTDVGATVTVEQAFTVAAGDVVMKAVGIAVTNGNYPADIRVTVLAVSSIGFCEVRIIPEAGDLHMDFYTDENGDTINETFYSHVEWVETAVGAGETLMLSRDFEVECSQPGAFPDAFELQVDVLPLHPVHEEDLMDNVRKNFPDVTVTGAAVDSDGDGFGNGVETFVGSLAAVGCAADPGANNESGPDAWPVDMDDNQRVNTVDVGFFVPRLGATSSEPNYAERYDLTFNGIINTIDVGRFVAHLGASCGAG